MRRLVVLCAFVLCAAYAVPAAAAPGDPTPTCRGRLATIVGTAADDVLVGTPGNDVIVGLAGNDVVRAGGGRDVVCGGPGDDVLRGGPGRDTLDGGDGNDRLVGAGGDDRLIGGPGGDMLRGGRGDDDLRAGPGRDRLHGDGGNDRLTGGAGGDRADAGPGLDACDAERRVGCGATAAPVCHRDYPEGCWAIRAGVIDVPLVVAETDGVARRPAPVTSGVPIPRDADLIDLSDLRVVDPAGEPVPAAFTALARWGADPGDVTAPVRWLLVDTQVAVGAGREAVLRLVDSGGPLPALPPLAVTETAAAVVVDTGATRLTVRPGDGSVLIGGLDGPLALRAAGPDGAAFEASGPVDVEVTEANGMRAAVRVHGSLRNPSGSALVDYTARFWLHAGLADVRLSLTIENETPCRIDDSGQIDCYDIGSDGSVRFDDISLVVPTRAGEYAVSAGPRALTGALTGDLVVYQDSSGTAAWDTYADLRDWDGAPVATAPRMQAGVSFRGYRVTLGDSVLASGDHAGGAIAVGDDDGWWTVLVPRFWESFPKALRATAVGLEVGVFPEEFDPHGPFTLRAGEHVTTEILIAHSGGPVPRPGAPLLAAAPAGWYAGSGAVGPLAPPAAGWPEYEDYVAAQLDPAPGYAPWMEWYSDLPTAIERTDFYGIFDYGDWPIDYEGYGVAPLNLKYDGNGGAWLQWLRGGDARWMELALAANHHLADIDILHTLHTPRHWSDGIVFGHSYHDEEGFSNPHRNHGGNHPDTMAGVEGLFLTYFLTGSEQARDAALEVADAIEYRLANDENLCSRLPGCSGEGWALGGGIHDDGERPAANALKISVDAFRATGDERYLRVATALVAWSDASRQPYIGGSPGGGGYLKPWMLGLYLRALGDYLDVAAEFGVPADGARASYLAYVDFLGDHVLLTLDPGPGGARAALPYIWSFDGGGGNGDPSVNDWLLLAADAFAYAHRLSGSADHLAAAEQLFRAGSHDPWYEGDDNTYSSTKELVNVLSFGQVFLAEWAGR